MPQFVPLEKAAIGHILQILNPVILNFELFHKTGEMFQISIFMELFLNKSVRLLPPQICIPTLNRNLHTAAGTAVDFNFGYMLWTNNITTRGNARFPSPREVRWTPNR